MFLSSRRAVDTNHVAIGARTKPLESPEDLPRARVITTRRRNLRVWRPRTSDSDHRHRSRRAGPPPPVTFPVSLCHCRWRPGPATRRWLVQLFWVNSMTSPTLLSQLDDSVNRWFDWLIEFGWVRLNRLVIRNWFWLGVSRFAIKLGSGSIEFEIG